MKKVSLILSVVVITVMILSSCGGKASTEVTIGEQIWMTQNLNVDKFRNGDPIPQAKTDAEWRKAAENEQPAWCYSNYDSANGVKYGKLYNWYAVNDSRGLAPAGYHIPSDAEWTKLETFLGSVPGTKMKSTSGWRSFSWSQVEKRANSGVRTNSSGFTGLPGGSRDGGIGKEGYWWSSTENDASTEVAWYRKLTYSNNYLKRYDGHMGEAMSVRCIRD